MQSRKYYERVVVVKIHKNPTIPLSEGNLIARLKDRNTRQEATLDCFVFDWRTDLDEGENALLEIHIVGVSKESPERKKSFSYKKISIYTNEYLVRGEIVEAYPDSEYPEQFNAVVDCGFHIFTPLAKSLGLKVGDYIQVEGRLDAHIIGKVN